MVRQILRFFVASPFSSLDGRSRVVRKVPSGEKPSSLTRAKPGSEVTTSPVVASTTLTLSLEAQAKYRPQGEYTQHREFPSCLPNPGTGE